MRLFSTLSSVMLLFATLQAQVPNYVPTDGLVGWWPFNGNANDESGNGNDGAVFGAQPTTDRFGQMSNAFFFDGLSDYIAINNSLLPTIETSFSVSLWFNSIGGSGHLFSERGPGIDYYKYSVSQIIIPGTEDTTVISRNYSAGCLSLQVFSGPRPAGWNHVVSIKDFGTGLHSLYLNSALVAQEALLCYHPSSNATHIGRWNSVPPSNYFNGRIDDIGFWDRALTPAEIQDLYNAGQQPVPCISPTPVSFNGLNSSYMTSDTPAMLTGTPTGGLFIGPGVSGSTFDPATAGEGTHSISYTYLDDDNCVNTYSLCTSVSLGMGLEPGGGNLSGVRVFPNPNRGQFTVELDLSGLVSLQVFDARGAVVHNEVFQANGAKTIRDLNLSGMTPGIYTVQVQNSQGRISQQVVID